MQYPHWCRTDRGRQVVTGRPAILFSDRKPSRCNGGGEELILREILLGLVQRGWRCLLAYHEWGELIPEYEMAGVSCRRFYLDPATLRQASGFGASVIGQALWARREGVVLYHCNSYFRAFHALAVKRLGGFAATCHFHIPPPEHYVSRQYRWGLERMDGLIAVSGRLASEWSRALGMARDRIVVLHNGIDTNRFRPDGAARASGRRALGVADDCFVIGYCGRLIPQKGAEMLVRAVAQLAPAHPAIKLLIVGSDIQSLHHQPERLEPQLRALAQRLGIVDRTDFLGTRRDVERWYNAMDVLVVPSLYSDPLPTVVLEGLACGRPVVGSRMGGIPEMLAGPLAQLLVPADDVDALAATLQRLARDPQWRAGMGRLGREAVERDFRVSVFLDRFEHLLKRVAA